MTLTTFVIASFAVWRFSHALVKENGPLMIFARLRARLGRTQKRSGGLFDLITCVYCISFWIGLLAALWSAGDAYHWVGQALGLSGASMFLEILFTKYSNSLSVVAPPTANHQVSVRTRTTPE